MLGDRPGLDLEFVAETGSTNADLLPRGDPHGRMVARVAELQTAGRGRVDRSWMSPAGAGLTFSVLLSDQRIAQDRLGWVGAILGLAVVRTLEELRPVGNAGLKWPNDLLVDERKCAGILAERTTGAVVVGMGVNVTLTAAELPRPDATSLLLSGYPIDRARLLAGVLQQFTTLVDQWRRAGGDVDAAGIRSAYLARCLTLGRPVTLSLPGGGTVSGTAVDIDASGKLLLSNAAGDVTGYTAGDVVHASLG